jgi:predicted nucleotidyltransferase
MTKTELLTKLTNIKYELQEQFGITQIALFGSYAKDDTTNESDVDIAIMKTNKKDYFLLLDAKRFIENILQKKVDLGYFDSIRPFVRKRIQKDLIYV